VSLSQQQKVDLPQGVRRLTKENIARERFGVFRFIMRPKREETLMRRIAIAAALCLIPVSLCAQWLDWRTPGIPRTPDGKPNLTAPAPRTPDGKPDLSGVWQPEVNPYRFDVIQDLKDEAIFRPAAEAIFMERVKDFRRDDPVTNCLPGGPSEMVNSTYRIIPSPTVVALLFENGTGRYRQIYTDGRKLPEDPNPTWSGYSVGHWEGDTLVVESAGFNDRTWLDRAGHPHSEKLRVTERFRRVDFGHMQFQITFDDPETLTKPLSLSLPVNYRADTDMLESVCNENNRDKAHMVSANAGIQVSSNVLEKYTGRYAYREGSRNVLGFMGANQNVTLVNGQLYLNALPLVPQTQTKFESTGADAEFFLDSNGKVTRLVLSQTEGDAIYDPKR
jgi:hypothetical protein